MAKKRKKTVKRNPPQRRVSRIRKTISGRVKHAKQSKNRAPKKHTKRATRKTNRVAKQRRGKSTSKPNRRAGARTPLRAAKGKKRRVKKTARVSSEQRLRRDLSKTRDRLRRTEDALAEVTRYTTAPIRDVSGAAPGRAPKEYEPSKAVRPTSYDPGIEVPTYAGEEWDEIDWDDFDWDYFDDYEDQEEDTYGDNVK